MITTVIPTYKRPQLLVRAIQSAQQQKVEGHVIQVLDNASGDETADVVQQMAQTDSRIKLFTQKENVGSLQNFLDGYKKVETEYFSFLSDDDLLLPGFYENAFHCFQQYPQAALFGASTIHVDGQGNICRVALKDRQPIEYWERPINEEQYCKGDFSTWTSIVFRKSFSEAIGGMKDCYVVDEELVLRLLIHFPCVISNKPAAIYISNPQSTSSHTGIQVIKAREQVIESVKNDTTLAPLEKRALIPVLQAANKKTLQTLFFKFLLGKKFSESKKCIELLEKHYGKNRPLRPILAFIQWKPFHLLFSLLVSVRRRWIQHKHTRLYSAYRKCLKPIL